MSGGDRRARANAAAMQPIGTGRNLAACTDRLPRASDSALLLGDLRAELFEYPYSESDDERQWHDERITELCLALDPALHSGATRWAGDAGPRKARKHRGRAVRRDVDTRALLAATNAESIAERGCTGCAPDVHARMVNGELVIDRVIHDRQCRWIRLTPQEKTEVARQRPTLRPTVLISPDALSLLPDGTVPEQSRS